MRKSVERYAAFAFGVVFVVVLLLLAIKYPTPTPFQYNVFRIVLALAAGGVAGMIPGFLSITISTWLRAGGALAVFVVVYFYSPAALTGVKVVTEQDVEIEKPVVQASSDGLLSLTVQKADQLLDPRVLSRRYQSLRIDGVKVSVPPHAAVVANEVEGLGGGALVGSDFSVIARRLANLTIDASGNGERGASPGSVRLYAKVIENSRIMARGKPGAPGKSGDAGDNGPNGPNGRDGDCAGFGGYHGADPGRDGGNAGNGHDGQPGGDGQGGGFVAITTIVNPMSSVIDVSGGAGGNGGAGGPPGTAGRGGVGGRGCTGLGGSQPNQADGRNGQPGIPGQKGPDGRVGAVGEYRLQIVKSFENIFRNLNTLPNEQLHAALLAP